MKRKLIIALAAAMTITLGSVGVVSADDTNFAPFIPVKETPIRDGFVWIVDTPSWIETVEHPEEGHYENGALISPEEGHTENVLVTEAWDEVVHHEAEYKTVHHEAEYKHHEAVYDTVHHPEEGHTEVHDVCNNCGAILANGTALEHIQQNAQNGCLSYGSKEIWIVDKAAWDEQVLVKEAWDELIKEAWDEQVLVKEAWDETIHHEAIYEDKWVVDKPAVYEQVWKVDKPAWTETIEHPEVGHWEPIPENPDEQEPETPQNPDEQEPETPQNPDEQEPETPQNPDEQNPETPDNNENNNQNENNSQNNNENTSQNNNSSETNNSQDDSTGKQPPKTGDPTNFASLYALAGSALAGIGAVKLKFRKRK